MRVHAHVISIATIYCNLFKHLNRVFDLCTSLVYPLDINKFHGSPEFRR